MMKLFYVGCGILLSGMAQIFLKYAANFEKFQPKWNIFIFLSLIAYGGAFFLYAMLLRLFPISRISPVMTTGVLVLVVLFGFVIGEEVGIKQAIGIMLGMASIYMLLS